MKTSRLLAYAIIGIISGLLIENKGMQLKASATKKANRLKKKIHSLGEKN